MHEMTDVWAFESYEISCGTGHIPKVRLTLRRGEEERTETMECGDGPVDAAFLAVEKITGLTVVCRRFQVQSVTVGKDAQGEVTVEVDYNGQTYKGRGVSTDSIEASVKAFLNAMNRIAVYRDAPTPIKAQG
jgi:2-isopropylmalate synthase